MTGSVEGLARRRFKIKLQNGELVGFIMRDAHFLREKLEGVRKSIQEEIGELLPRDFKLLLKGTPLSKKQETLNALEDIFGPDISPHTSVDVEITVKAEVA